MTCPCCGERYRRFAPFGLEPRDNAICHNCGSLERHRLLWLYLTRRLQLFDRPLKLLHFAPEPIFIRKFMEAANIDYYPCDLSPETLPAGVRRMDITEIQFADESFDAILCNHVLEHVQDDEGAMRELRRVLRVGGWAILQVPIDPNRSVTFEDPAITDPESRLLHFGQHDHVRRYGRDYVDRLRSAGFHVNIDDFVGTLSDQEINKFGVAPTESVFVCSKGQPKT